MGSVGSRAGGSATADLLACHPDWAARSFALREATMPKPVPNTQTGSLTDHQRGSDDTLIGLAGALNILYGDAFGMDDHARGGDDTLAGGAHAANRFSGAAQST